MPAPVSIANAPAVANERRKLNLAAPSKVVEKVAEPKEVEKPVVTSVEPVAAPDAADPAVAASSAPAEKKPIKKKKKKKDLSTFKPK